MRGHAKGQQPQNRGTRGTTGADGWTPKVGELVHLWAPGYGEEEPFSGVYEYRVPHAVAGYGPCWRLRDLQRKEEETWDEARCCYRMSEAEQAAYRLTGEVPNRG